MRPLNQGFKIPDVPTTAPAETGESWRDEVARLAELPGIEYERVRKSASDRLGSTVRTLDAEVKAARKAQPKPRAPIVEDIEPWPEPVDGANLLDDIAETARKYAVLPAGGAEVIALWILHSHAVDAFFHSPRLAVMAPEKRCGKTVVLDLLEVLTPRAIKTKNLTTAVLFRLCDEVQPTVLADEVDGFLKSSPELVSMLNAGHKRGGKALRCEGDENAVRAFNVFGACALAGIGSLPATLADRSLAVNMRRASKDESPVPFRSDRARHERTLARKAARWAADNIQALKTAEPSVPIYMFNRVADNWRPIFAIAETCGSDWPQKATVAAAAITDDTTAEPSVGEMLLADIKAIFDEIQTDRITSESLALKLAEIESRPWPEFGRMKKPISKTQIANVLRRYKVSPTSHRFLESTAKGYKLEQFKDAFAAYLPSQAVTPSQAMDINGLSDFKAVTTENDVTAPNQLKALASKACDVVTDPYTMTPEEAEVDRQERQAIQEEGSPDDG